LICRNAPSAKIANGDGNTAERSLAVPAVSGAVRFSLLFRAAPLSVSSSMTKHPKKIWYVSFDDQPSGRRLRSAQAFESESEAKQFAKDALSSGKVVYAGTLNPHEPRRFIPFEKIDEWLNEHHQGEHNL
jgi:hypothetical protein